MVGSGEIELHYLARYTHRVAILDDSNISTIVDSTAEYERVDFVTGNYYSVLGVQALPILRAA